MKFLNPFNYLRFIINRIINLRIRYGSPIKVTSKALDEKVDFIVSSEKEEWADEKHGTVSNILYIKNQKDRP